MRKIISWLLGFSLGAALGAAIVMVLVSLSGQDLSALLKSRYRESLNAGHYATEAKRAEMEEELRKMRAARGLTPKTL